MATKPLTLEAFTEFTVILGAGTDDYAEHTASCAFIPTGGTEVRWKGGTPGATVEHRTKSDWTCQMRVAQDFSTNGLAKYLLDNEGAKVPCGFTPISGGPTFYATLILSAPQIGGDIDTYGEATVTHTSTKPTTAAPTP